MAKREHYKLPVEVVEKLIDPMFTKNMKNRRAIKSMVLNIFGSHQIELLVSMLHKDVTHKELFPGCYVLVEPKNYWEGEIYDGDRMRDIGLMHSDGKVYGQVKDDSSWDTDSFNPYYVTYKVELLIVDKDLNLQLKLEEIPMTSLEFIDKSEIKYFKAKKDAI
jgi:hypothetical protein